MFFCVIAHSWRCAFLSRSLTVNQIGNGQRHNTVEPHLYPKDVHFSREINVIREKLSSVRHKNLLNLRHIDSGLDVQGTWFQTPERLRQISR